MVEQSIGAFRGSSAKKMDLRRGIVLTGAAEQMFFFGAPLAHIVAYEEWRRGERVRQMYRRQIRMARGTRLELPPVV